MRAGEPAREEAGGAIGGAVHALEALTQGGHRARPGSGGASSRAGAILAGEWKVATDIAGKLFSCGAQSGEIFHVEKIRSGCRFDFYRRIADDGFRAPLDEFMKMRWSRV